MDHENKENIPPAHDSHVPSQKDDEEHRDQMHPPTPPRGAVPLGERRHVLRPDVADDCMSFAENHLAGMWPHIERLENAYQIYGATIEEDHLNAIGYEIMGLASHAYLARDLSVLVDQYISDAVMGLRTQAVRAHAAAVKRSLNEFMFSMAEDMHLGESDGEEEEEEQEQEREREREHEPAGPGEGMHFEGMRFEWHGWGCDDAAPRRRSWRHSRQPPHAHDFRWARGGRERRG